MLALVAGMARRFVGTFALFLPFIAFAQDVTAPSVPSALVVGNLTAGSLTLSWTASTDNVGVTGYEVFRNGASIGTTTATSIAVSGLSELTTYYFTIRARDAANNWSVQSALCYTRTWDRLHHWGVNLTYTEGQDEEGYGNGQWEYSTAEVYFVANGPFKVYANSTSLSLTVRKDGWGDIVGSSNGSVVSYTSPTNQAFRAYLTNGEGDFDIYVDVAPPSNQPPVANFSLSTNSGRAPLAVDFTNSGSSDPDGLIAGYSWDLDNNGTVEGTGATASYTYPNTGTSPISYTAKLTVLDSAGGSGSTTRTVMVYPASSFGVGVQNGTTSQPFQMSGSTITLTAAAPPIGQQFGYWSIVSGSGTFANANETPTTFTVGSADTVVKANYVPDVTAPAVPTGVAVSDVTAVSLKVSWPPATDNVGVTGYEVFRNGTSIGTTTMNSISVSGLSELTTYYFTVRARDAANNWSAQSALCYTRTWDRLHHWGVNLTYTEGQDEEGYGNGQWEYSTAEVYFVANGPFKVYANSANLSLTVRKDGWGDIVGTSNGSVIPYISSTNQAFRAYLTNGEGDFDIYVDVAPANQAPVANFDMTVASGRAPLLVNFANNGSADPDGVIVGYTWDFDNNGTTDASGANASYTYANTGTSPITYVAKFTVLDSGGASTSLTKSLIVYPASSHGVVVQNGASSLPFQVTGSTVTLTADVPLNGQQFSHWSIVLGTGTFANANSNSTTLTIGSGNVEVKANYVVDATPPSVPANVVASEHTAISMKLSWSAATDNVVVAGYEIYRNGTLVGETSATSIVVRGLTQSTDYQFTVRAKDAASNLSASSTIVYARTWQHRVTWSGTLTHTEELDEEGNGTGQWTYSNAWRIIQAYEASGPFKAYVVIPGGAELTVALPWTSQIIGQTSDGSYIASTGNGSQAYQAWLSKGDGDFQFYLDVPSSNQLPIASFTISPTAGIGPSTTITVNASTSSDPDGPTGGLTYAWDFDGNGTTDATGITATWTYTNTSNAWVYCFPRLRVTDIATGQSELSKAFVMYPPGSRSVSVQGGAPSEPYLWPYDTVTLIAGAPATGQAFLGWTLISGTGTIADPTAKVTTFTATGSSNIVVKANYGADVVPPSVPPAFQVGSVTGRTATLTWTSATDNVGVVLYEIYNGATFLAATASTTITLNNLSPSTTYLFNVKAVDAAGLKSAPTASVVAGTWKRLLDASGTIDSDEGAGTTVTFTFTVAEAGMLRLYTTGSTPTRANLAGPTNLGWVEGAGGNVAFTRQVSSGAYTLTVAGHNGDVSGDFQVFVEHGVHLQPDFQATPDAGTGPLVVSFNAGASLDPNGSAITSYAWDFDNNGTTDATGITASHTYQSGNVYTAKLTIANSVGVTASITRKIVTQNVQAFASAMTPIGATMPTPGSTVSPNTGRVGTQVALSTPSHDSQGNPFHAWTGGLVEEVHNRIAAMTLSPWMTNVTAMYLASTGNQAATTYLQNVSALAQVGQAFEVTAHSKTPSVNGTHLIENKIEYSTDFGQTWIDGTIAAGTKWRKAAQDDPMAEHQLISSFSFSNPGWVFFRAMGVTNNYGASAYAYGKTLIVTKNESDVVAVVNGTATPASGPAGTIVQLSASQALGPVVWWEVLSGSGTIATPQVPWTTFTKGSGPVVLRANPGTPYTLTVGNGQSNRASGAIGSSFQITANAPPAGHLFDRWELTAGEGTFSSDLSASTTFVMGLGGATIRAVYRSADAPTTLIARSRSTVPRGDTFEITATAKDPNGNLAWLEIEYSTDEGKTWVAASSAAITPPPAGQPLPQGPQGPTRWAGTGASKTISVAYFFDPFKWTTYWFRTRSGDASGYVSSYAMATVSVLNNKPKVSILAQSGGVVENGSSDAANIPELQVTTGSLFDIIADGAAPTVVLEEVRVDYLHGGIFKEGKEANGRLWKPEINNSTPEGRVKKTFSASELGIGVHQFQARSLFKKVYSDYGYIRVKVIPPTPASVAKPIASKILQAGQNGDLSVEPAGSYPMTIQWYKNNALVSDSVEISGVKTRKIEFRPAKYEHRGAYKALVSNEHGGEPSNAADLIVNRPPVASFTASSNSGTAPFTVTFDASGSSDPDSSEPNSPDSISAYIWDFGNGRTQTTTTPTVYHKYYAIGSAATFNVRLTVWDSRGGKADAGPVPITVGPLPGGGADTDGDGIPDAWEDALGLNKNDPADGLADKDKDGWTNVAEYNNQTDPDDAASYPGKPSQEPSLGAEWPTGAGNFVGFTPGSAAVNLNGAATYSVPIKVTPGSVGMQPELSLDYSSQGGDGYLGLGWQLSGLPVITRGPATKINDGTPKGVSFSSDDRFYLNGARLIGYGSGDYGSHEKEYRTEIDSFSRIVSYGTGGSPSHFKVWTKSGQVLEFGSTRNSRLEPANHGGKALVWAVSKISDRSGNWMEVAYRSAEEPGSASDEPTQEILPLTISYTHHNGASSSGYATVNFTYREEARPDIKTGYAFNAAVVSSKLLDKITIKLGTTNPVVFRQYRLDYHPLVSSTPPRLKSIQEADGDLTTANVYPATEFKYYEPAEGGFSFSNAQTINGAPIRAHVADFDGDGLSDIVSVDRGNLGINFVFYRNNGKTFDFVNSAFSSGGYLDLLNVIDLAFAITDSDGDGRSEIVSNPTFVSGSGPRRGFVYKIRINSSGQLAIEDSFRIAGFDSAVESVPISASTVRLRVADFTGDGREDLLIDDTITYTWTNGASTTVTMPYVQLCVATATGGYESVGRQAISPGGEVVGVGDFTGDGLPDLLALAGGAKLRVYSFDPLTKVFAYRDEVVLGGSGGRLIPADVNGDRQLDVLHSYKSSDATHIDGNKVDVWMRTGSTFVLKATQWLGGWNPEFRVCPFDYDGDAKTDIAILWKNVASGGVTTTQLDVWRASGPTSAPFVATLNQQVNDRWFPDVSQYRPQTVFAPAQLDRDGLGDLLYLGFDSASGAPTVTSAIRAITKPSASNKPGAFPNLLESVVDGLGVETTFSYLSLLSDTIYTKGKGAVWPEVDVRLPFKAVSVLSRERSEGSRLYELYTYGDLRVNVQRGLEGFGWIRRLNVPSNIETKTQYYQVFPYTGMPKEIKVTHGEQGEDGQSGTLISSVKNEVNYNAYTPIPGGGEVVFSPYVSESYMLEYDLSGLSTRTKYSTASQDKYGNMTASYERVAVDEVAKANMKDGLAALLPGQFERRVSTTFDSDETNWLINRPTRIETYAKSGDYLLDFTTRVSETTYYPNTNRVKDVIQEPDAFRPTNPIAELADFYVKTTLTYDSWGNVNSTTVSGPSTGSAMFETRSSSVDYSVTGDHPIAGRFPGMATDALGQKISFAYDAVTGRMKKRKDETTRLEVTWVHDSFGTSILETRPDGATSTTYRWDTTKVNVDGGAKIGAKYHVDVRITGAPPVLTRYDSVGLPIQQMTVAGDGVSRYSETRYNERGEVVVSSRAHTKYGDVFWTTAVYDSLGRVTERSIPASGGGTGGWDIFNYSYSKLSATETDPRNVKTATTTNALGLVAAVERNAGAADANVPDRGTVSYKYDGYGNVREMKDPAGNAVTTDYNRVGGKAKLVDLNMGEWAYAYYANGLLRTQTDAKLAVTTITYDKLDRKLTEKVRVNQATADSRTVTWSYNNNPDLGAGISTPKMDGARQLGGVVVEEDSGNTVFQQSWTYDEKSRVSGGTRIFPGGRSYTFGQTYDDEGRPKTTTYSTGTPSFATITSYGPLGHLRDVRRHDGTYANGRGQFYWRAAEYEEDGQLRLAYLGNGAAVDRCHYEENGRPQGDAISLNHARGSSAIPPLLTQSYGFDGNGNLKSRGVLFLKSTGEEVRYTEEFGYDGMNRVTTVVPAAPSSDPNVPPPTVAVPSRSYSYDKIGNMLSKDGNVFSYSRTDSAEPLAPHAVRAAMGVSYGYDANGNLSKINNVERVTWKPFNQPAKIENAAGTESSSFAYGPDRERVTQTTKAGKVTFYVGSLHEVLVPYTSPTNGQPIEDQREERMYVMTPMGRTAVVQFNGNAATLASTRYLTQDQLTSTSLVTNELGVVTERFSYDPWGAPRDPEMLSTSAPWPDRAATTRGYTDHEMLSRLQLTHMNGRIYNPALGRFLSPDPFVNSADGVQMLNRYAYVRNSPLSFIDPSGYQVSGSGWAPVPAGQGGVLMLVPKPDGGVVAAWVATNPSSGVTTNLAFTSQSANNLVGLRVPASGLQNTTIGVGSASETAAARGGLGFLARLNPFLYIGGLLAPTSLGNSEMRPRDGYIIPGGADSELVAEFFRIRDTDPERARALLAKMWDAADNSAVMSASRYNITPSIVRQRDGGELALLREHLDSAIARFEVEGYTAEQAASIQSSPGLAAAHRGTQIDSFFKDAVKGDSRLQHLQITPRYKFGPDVFDPFTQRWWDVTTPGEWQKHVEKYWLFGEGLPLFH